MLQVKTFVFNSFQVNTYVVYAENKDCIIIDPACGNANEVSRLLNYIETEGLNPLMVANTHAHVDHILANDDITAKLGIKLAAHPASHYFYLNALNFSEVLGLKLNNVVYPELELQDNDTIKLGDDELKILYTPGHADGSICFYNAEGHFVISGDLIFYASIGRTDFPTGNFETLSRSIKEKIFTLPDDTVIYPGHGPKTSVGFEKYNNPFVSL
ncbi:MAG: MBL fold metallo-hydrolase [Bacteroidota bacterium]|nr:MBL fold metallo-hydrolase [Bacteroidota bacterium]